MSVAITRDGSTVVITRTDAGGVQTVTGHNLCAVPEEAEGLQVARLFEAASELHALMGEALGIVAEQTLVNTFGQEWVDRAQAALAAVSGGGQ